MDHFVYRVVREIGPLVSVLGGIDNLVFTAGIGDCSSKISADLAWLGLRPNVAENWTETIRTSTQYSVVKVFCYTYRRGVYYCTPYTKNRLWQGFRLVDRRKNKI